MTLSKCKICKGAGGLWKMIDMSEFGGYKGEARVRCEACKGAGYVDQSGRPVHINEVHL